MPRALAILLTQSNTRVNPAQSDRLNAGEESRNHSSIYPPPAIRIRARSAERGSKVGSRDTRDDVVRQEPSTNRRSGPAPLRPLSESGRALDGAPPLTPMASIVVLRRQAPVHDRSVGSDT